jgi:hypothetical protein
MQAGTPTKAVKEAPQEDTQVSRQACRAISLHLLPLHLLPPPVLLLLLPLLLRRRVGGGSRPAARHQLLQEVESLLEVCGGRRVGAAATTAAPAAATAPTSPSADWLWLLGQRSVSLVALLLQMGHNLWHTKHTNPAQRESDGGQRGRRQQCNAMWRSVARLAPANKQPWPACRGTRGSSDSSRLTMLNIE